MDAKFSQKHSEDQEAVSASEAAREREFATSDELLQHDRDQNPPPPEIAERLNQSLANEPRRGTSFWSRLGFKK